MVSRHFIVIWDKQGLTWVEDVTRTESLASWSILKGEQPKFLSSHLKNAILHTIDNPELGFEIYSVDTVENLSVREFVKLFNKNPSASRESIRNIGSPITLKKEKLCR